MKIENEIPKELNNILNSQQSKRLFIIAKTLVIFDLDQCRSAYMNRYNLKQALAYFIENQIVKKINKDTYQYIYEEQNNNEDDFNSKIRYADTIENSGIIDEAVRNG